MDLEKEKRLQDKINQLEKEVDRIKKAVKQTKYGLVWMDVPEAFDKECENRLPILKEIPEKEVINDDDKPTHILIEGDNYHALTCLNYTHKGKIDVIYIDPPYNLGGDDFKYKDKRIIDRFPDGTVVPVDHPLRHSYWLSFMAKRLELTKDLLSRSGVVFISIDDNEIANLRHLCDKIYGEQNFYGCLTWIKRTKSTNSGKSKYMLQPKVEYILVYGKKKATDFSGFNLLYGKNKKRYPHTGKLGACRFENIEATDYGRKRRDTMKFPIMGIKPREGRRWQIGEDEAERLICLNRIEIVDGIPKVAVYPGDEIDTSFVPFWSHLEGTGSAEDGKKQLSEILGGNHGFDTVKPINLIKKIIERLPEDAVILDYFAGSATTAHAVLEMNKEDDGKRQFVMCTNNENNICADITYPRIEKVISGYYFKGKARVLLYDEKITVTSFKKANEILSEIDLIESQNESKFDTFETKIEDDAIQCIGVKNITAQKEGLGGSLKYYKTAFIGKNNILKATDEDKIELAHQAGDLLALAENTLYKVKENKFWQLYENSERYTAIYFREELGKFDEFVTLVEKLEYPATIYVFSWGDDEFAEEFEHIRDVKVKTIPLPILEIYKNIYNVG